MAKGRRFNAGMTDDHTYSLSGRVEAPVSWTQMHFTFRSGAGATPTPITTHPQLH